MTVSCKHCKHNADNPLTPETYRAGQVLRTSTCKLSGVTSRKDYNPHICYEYEHIIAGVYDRGPTAVGYPTKETAGEAAIRKCSEKRADR